MFKRIMLLLLLPPIWAGCTQKYNLQLHSKEFTHTGCASGLATKAGPDDGEVSLLILKYEDGNLRVTRTNAMMNCSIKQGGIACEVSIDGNIIQYKVYEKDGPNANCMCRVEEMTSVVTGLQAGKEYSLDYYFGSNVCGLPIPFTFGQGLYLVLDEEALLYSVYEAYSKND